MTYDLEHFDISEMLRCGRGIREIVQGQTSLAPAADAIVRHFYDGFVGIGDGARQCLLVRFYKTHAYESLTPELQRFARGLLPDAPSASAVNCLTLLATVGDEPDWCDRRRSRGHQAIPLVSVDMIEQAPMIAMLLRDLGLDAREVIEPATPAVYPHTGKSFNVFHVEHALGSQYIPAQAEFVVPYGVRSVVGFGGLLRSGSLFAVIIFARVPIAPGTAERFRHVALDVKYALYNLDDEDVFTADGDAPVEERA